MTKTISLFSDLQKRPAHAYKRKKNLMETLRVMYALNTKCFFLTPIQRHLTPLSKLRIIFQNINNRTKIGTFGSQRELADLVAKCMPGQNSQISDLAGGGSGQQYFSAWLFNYLQRVHDKLQHVEKLLELIVGVAHTHPKRFLDLIIMP